MNKYAKPTMKAKVRQTSPHTILAIHPTFHPIEDPFGAIHTYKSNILVTIINTRPFCTAKKPIGDDIVEGSASVLKNWP